MEQRTQEWHDARANKVTASSVGAILGLSPWQTREDVMQTMLGNKKVDNPALDWGVYNETQALHMLETNHNINPEAVGFVTHDRHPWLGASPDGLVGHEYVLEVKCPYSLRNDPEPTFKSLLDQPHYMAQMQIQMACTGRLKGIFFQWSPHGSKIEYVGYDPIWMMDNLPKLEAFYNDFLARQEEDVSALVDEMQGALDALDTAKERVEDAKQAMIDYANGTPRKIGPFSVSKVEKKGSISYSKAVKDNLKDVDLEQYRGEPSTYWTVR